MARRYHYRQKKESKLSLQKLIVPVGIATFTEPMFDNLVNQFAGQLNVLPAGIQIDDVAKVGIGYFLGKKGGIVGDTAKVYAIFGARNLISQMLGGITQPAMKATSSSATF